MLLILKAFYYLAWFAHQGNRMKRMVTDLNREQDNASE